MKIELRDLLKREEIQKEVSQIKKAFGILLLYFLIKQHLNTFFLYLE